MMDLRDFLPAIVPMSSRDYEKLSWKGVLRHIGPVSDATPLQVALTGKTNCALYLIYMGCIAICIKRTQFILDQRLNPMLLEQVFAYQYDWRYPKPFGITIDDVENLDDKTTAIRRSLLYFFFEIVGKAKTFFAPVRPVSEISFIINLTRHLCGKENASVVDGWVAGIIERMNQIAPFTGHNDPVIYNYPDRESWEAAARQTHGTPLPPEVLDLARDLSGLDLATMATNWLFQIDPEVNPLLQPADVVIAKGFQGIPYRTGP